jgi:hypothetical protein
MLVRTIPYSCHINLGTCIGGLTFVHLCWKRSLESLSASPVQCLLCLRHSSDSGWPKISSGAETVNHPFFSCNFHSVIDKNRCQLCSSSRVLFLPFWAANTISTHSLHSLCTSKICPWNAVVQTFPAFKIISLATTSQIMGFSIFVYL